MSGALIQETYPSGRTVTNTLNADGELEKVESQKTTGGTAKLYLSDIAYNSAGLIEKARLGNGKWESARYNERLQVKQIALGHSNTDKSLLRIDYDYGTNLQNNGGLREQKINYAGLSNQITQTYTYDNLNRLESAMESFGTSQQAWKQTFAYDRFGNREFNTTGSSTTTLDPLKAGKVTNPLINESDNRLQKDQDGDSITDYDYDKAGNLILDAENQRFVYDAENHQTQFFGSANTTQTPDATYQYDGMGKRVRKKSGQVETIFVYNGGGVLIAEYSTQISTTPQARYLTADHLGSPRIITDGGGMVISRHDYMAFGGDVTETIGNVGGRAMTHGYGNLDEVRQGYTGYQKDDESGLDFAQARYYNSSHGRFTSVDPLTASANIRDPQTFNRYSYVLNSPYKFTDPLGLLPVSIACGSTCPNSGPMVDGSAFRGTDTSFGWAKQQAAPPPPPPPPATDLTDAEIRAQYPVFNAADQVVVNRAISDAENIVDPREATNITPAVLTDSFINPGDTTTPQQAIEALDATSGVNITRNADGDVTKLEKQNVFDGRTSTLPVDADGNPTTTATVTVAEYFRTNSDVVAVEVNGDVFLGSIFFSNNHGNEGRAKTMIHEGVVHKGFGRSDTDFGSSQTIGSRAINARINNAYRTCLQFNGKSFLL